MAPPGTSQGEVEGGEGRAGNGGVQGFVRVAGGESLEGRGKAGASETSRLTPEGEVGSGCRSTSASGVTRQKESNAQL